MDRTLDILEFFLFFLFFGLTFKALMSVDSGKLFFKNALWQMQIITILSALALAYLVNQALMRLITLALSIL